MRNSPSPNNHQAGAANITVIALLVVSFLSAIVLGNLIAQGDFLTAYLGLLAVLGIVALQQLKSTFWLLIPFAMVSQLPAISIIVASLTLGELWILASLVFVIFYWIQERRSLTGAFSGPGIWMYAYLIWALLVLASNPVGLSFTGAASGGLRFYLKIILGFIAFLIIANSELDNKFSRRLIVLLIAGVAAEAAFKLLGAYVPQISFLTAQGAGSALAGGGFYGVTAKISIVPALVAPFLLARYSFAEMIQPKNWWVIVTLLVLVAMSFLSGKRSLTVLLFMYPVIIALIRGQLVKAIGLGMPAFGAFALLLLLQASGVTLPKTTQRVLSIIPGVTGLDYDVIKSADNDFRETLNRFALVEIKEKPLIGDGFKMDQEMLYYLDSNPDKVLGLDDHIAGARYAATSAWHNTWLGMSADFGIPAALIFALLMIFYIRKSLWLLKRLEPKSSQYLLVIGLLAIVIGELLRSYQFGHACHTYWQISWKVGVLFAIENALKLQARMEFHEAENRRTSSKVVTN